MLVGAEIPTQDAQRYLNAVVTLGGVVGADGVQAMAVEGIPVPVSMWKPWADDGAIADVWARGGQVTVNGQRAAVLICYEQFLTWSIIERFLAKPDVLVGVSNVWWTGGDQMPRVQQQTMQVWGRLFAVGVVLAANH